MKNTIYPIIVTLFISVQSLGQEASSPISPDSILGIWISEDGNAKFEIYKSDKKYFGKIIWGTGRDSRDSNNPDPKLRNQELVGLTILKDLVYEKAQNWSNGEIYDPNDGKTYSCKLTLRSNDRLEVRGYLGFSLFGRTETWTRTYNDNKN
jgi:uncharacterized protein (DUF2147 family)